MNKLYRCKASMIVVALFAGSGAMAATMSHEEYSAAKDRISADYKVDKATCDRMNGNQKDVCVEKAKGAEKISKAELEYRYSGKESDGRKIAIVKADAQYEIAKELCDDRKGNDEDVCEKEAKAEHEKALADAKAKEKISDARSDAAEKKQEVDQELAIDTCDAMSGNEKSVCLNAARSRQGIK